MGTKSNDWLLKLIFMIITIHLTIFCQALLNPDQAHGECWSLSEQSSGEDPGQVASPSIITIVIKEQHLSLWQSSVRLFTFLLSHYPVSSDGGVNPSKFCVGVDACVQFSGGVFWRVTSPHNHNMCRRFSIFASCIMWCRAVSRGSSELA